jgi:hypothetical protein
MDNIRPGGPLPRPQHERLSLPDDQHMTFWRQVIRDFEWTTSREQSLMLYKNVVKAPYEGEIGS